MNSAVRWTVPLLAVALCACGARSEDVAKTSNGEGQRTKAPAKAVSSSDESPGDDDAGAAASDSKANDDTASPNASTDERNTDDPTQALAAKKGIDPGDSNLPLPQCAAPLEADFGYPTFGTEAVRLHWRPKTGECRFTSGDGTPEGWTGILTLRHHDDDLFLSGIGQWRYYAPQDLDLDALPPDETLTFYPYLGDWQFVIDIRYVDNTVTIERFQYIAGKPPADFGIPDETSNEPVAGPMLVPCASLTDGAEQGDAQ